MKLNNISKNNITLNTIIILIILCISLSLYVFSLNIENTKNVSPISNIENFTNISYQDVVFNERRDKLMNEIKKYEKLDLPININDNGHLCQDWNNDPKKRYPNAGNVCQLVGNDAVCIDNNNKTSKCNKIYNRDIKDIATIDVKQLAYSNFNQLVPMFKEIDKVISDKELILHNLINQIIQLKNTKYQQEYFLTMNKDYLLNSNNRKTNIEKKYDDETNQNGINIDNFNLYKREINELIESNKKFYKYNLIAGILLFILVIVFFLSTRIEN